MSDEAKKISQLHALINSMVALAYRGRSLRMLMKDTNHYKYPTDVATMEFMAVATDLCTECAGEYFLSKLKGRLSDGLPLRIINVCSERYQLPSTGTVKLTSTVEQVIRQLQKFAPYATVAVDFSNPNGDIAVFVPLQEP